MHALLQLGESTPSGRQLDALGASAPSIGVPLPRRSCGRISPECAAFERERWQPYVTALEQAPVKHTCWRMTVPATLGLADTLSMLLPTTAEAVLTQSAVELRLQLANEADAAGANKTALGVLGLLHRSGAAGFSAPQCAGDRVSDKTNVFGRATQGVWKAHAPIEKNGHRIQMPHRHRLHDPEHRHPMRREAAPLGCLLRLFLCPVDAVQRSAADVRARLSMSRGGREASWLAVHARLGSGSHEMEPSLMRGIKRGWEAASLSPGEAAHASNSSESLASRMGVFERFLEAALPAICDDTVRARYCGARDAGHNTAAAGNSGMEQRRRCPSICSRSEQRVPLGIRRAFAAVDEVASAGERVFFSTDSAELQVCLAPPRGPSGADARRPDLLGHRRRPAS